MHLRLSILSLAVCGALLAEPVATVKGIHTGGTGGMSEGDDYHVPFGCQVTEPMLLVELAEPLTEMVTIKVETSEGTATPDVDYYPLSRELVFPPGQTKVATRISILCDVLDEDDETIILTATQEGQVRATEVATILDDDWTPDANMGDESVTESDTDVVFKIRLSPPNKVPMDVDYTTIDGTAVAGSDYVAKSGTLRIWPRESVYYLRVHVLGDKEIEPDETFSVQFSNPRYVSLDRTSVTATIVTDDFPPPPFTLVPATRVEGDAGPRPAVLDIELGTAHASPVTVTVQPTGEGSATAGVDYEMSPQTLTFPPGVTELVASATILGDTIKERDEGFEVAVLEDGVIRATGLVMILDDDDQSVPVISIGDIQVIETDSLTQAVFPVTLSKPASDVVRVAYRTVTGTAVTSVDHWNTSGELLFSPGDSTRTVTVNVMGDRVREGNETFELEIYNARGAKIGDGFGTCTIIDDEPTRRRAARH